LALSTWDTRITPVVHYSSCRQIEDPKARKQAHADYIYEYIDAFDHNIDIMLETKAKEIALLQYRKKHSILI
jgi:UV DNA damage endonuclease